MVQFSDFKQMYARVFKFNSLVTYQTSKILELSNRISCSIALNYAINYLLIQIIQMLLSGLKRYLKKQNVNKMHLHIYLNRSMKIKNQSQQDPTENLFRNNVLLQLIQIISIIFERGKNIELIISKQKLSVFTLKEYIFIFDFDFLTEDKVQCISMLLLTKKTKTILIIQRDLEYINLVAVIIN
ncbi:unnamed protein product [Paramecium sonneborni]|uniref:Uncharacterized protein n=1 Tax=Paramecium sonneborni TaxID=65129 RepID=A0A8S1QYE5_9CILI|nr:unnamed protein product [Paramecium sonneborni]